MTDSEITDLLKNQNNKITISQIQSIQDYDPTAYGMKYLGGLTYSMWSIWGGYWEFQYKQ